MESVSQQYIWKLLAVTIQLPTFHASCPALVEKVAALNCSYNLCLCHQLDRLAISARWHKAVPARLCPLFLLTGIVIWLELSHVIQQSDECSTTTGTLLAFLQLVAGTGPSERVGGSCRLLSIIDCVV